MEGDEQESIRRVVCSVPPHVYGLPPPPPVATLQDATWLGLVGTEDGGEPEVALIRGTPLLYAARVMGYHTGVAGTTSGGIS